MHEPVKFKIADMLIALIDRFLAWVAPKPKPSQGMDDIRVLTSSYDDLPENMPRPRVWGRHY